ncbi:ComEC/Rec2 family competence protein [Thermomonospora cellulosilytica]|uniref:Competence protein ComEC n=1 Tax=Thermomonospora cellulosilytica TaxID=1411118 RepID=A0A7W3N3N4_9ACTN|nr:ComEC/Rec2 family competence protein [Thermomonospora cellulosilytica]MBA9006919.1 competence protein ComEC [Thermomonospora cellulosilytica]
MGAVLVCVAASAAGTGLRLSAVSSGPVRDLAEADARVSLEAVVTGDPQVRQSEERTMALVRARAERVRAAGRPITVRVPVLLIGMDPAWRSLVPGQRVRANARLAPPRHAELLAAVGIVRGPPQPLGEPPAVQRAAETVRARLREAAAVLPADQGAVLPGMVVGDTSRLPPELAEDFAAAGLTHLLVVSGANLAIVAGAVLAICRFTGLGRRRAPVPAALALLAFVVVARPEPSVLRATVMALIGLLAFMSGRERQGLPALSAAVLLLVLLDPGLARSYGFALSVLATGGLLVLAPRWRERLRRRLPGPVAEGLAVTAAAQLACLPVLVMLTGEIAAASIAANMLAMPAVPVATLLGALTAAIAPVAMPVARLTVWPAGLAVGWIIGVARVTAGIPYATLPWREGTAGAAAVLLAGAVGYLLWRCRPLLALAAAVLSGVIAAGVLMRVTAPDWPPAGWQYVACDVGQGDAGVLATGPGQAVVVDTGPDPDLVDSCLDGLGVRSIPLLVLTHPHADHIDGTPGVRRGRSVGTVVTSARTNGKEDRHLAELAVRPATAGHRWRIGDLTLEILAPATTGPALLSDADGEAVNNTSVVLLARRPGFSALLTGDIEIDAQRALLPRVPHVQLLKVPHHGARYQDPAFLAATRATISITSVGEGNDYGHPAPSTLALLQRLGMRVYRTDLHGDIAVVPTRRGLTVITRQPRPGGKIMRACCRTEGR